MLATQVLAEDFPENVVNDEGETVGFLLIDDKRYVITKGETKIGRDPSLCTIVIENFTVSKVHAVVESDGIDDTFIYDINSTNQTKLGKKVLKPHCRYKLDNDSKLTFGNIAAKFILPPKVNNSSEFYSNSDNINDLEDIFEIATQVSAPQPCTSGKILQLEKVSDNTQIFKIPKMVVPQKAVTEPHGSSEIAKVPEFHSNLKEESKTQCCDDVFETSAVFNLDTQCQIISPSSNESKCEKQNSSAGNSSKECDKVEFLLNDGEDDVLCTFMSLHSPSGRTLGELPKKIKTEIVEENESQLFNMETQVQAVLNSSKKKNVEQLNLKEDFSSQNLTQQSISSTPLNKNPKSNSSGIVLEKSKNIEQAEEDIIETQEFKVNLELTTCRSTSVCCQEPPIAPEESDIECYFDETIDFSTDDKISENEDLICTQKFETLNKSPKENMEKIIENEESNESREDLMETQIYDIVKECSDKASENEELQESKEDIFETQIFDFEKEKSDNETEKEKSKTIPDASFVVPDSSEKNKTCAEEQIDLSQKDLEEDFICTQAFSVTEKNNHLSGSSSPERNDEDSCDDDEDFIATQPVDLLSSKSTKSELSRQSNSNAQTSCRESSDILDSGSLEKISEQFNSTDSFSNSKSKSSKSSFLEFSERIDSVLSSNIKTELNKDVNYLPTKVAETQSSGDETESDLEIVYDKSVTLKKTLKIKEFTEESSKDDSQPSTAELSSNARNSEVHENDESNSSYVFQLESESHVKPETSESNSIQTQAVESDSDATDCEEMSVINLKMPIKQEPITNITFEDTQVLTLSPPSDFAQVSNHFDVSPESPKFDIKNDNENGGQVSSEKSDSQDATNKHLRNEEAQKQCKENEEYQTPLKIKKTEVGAETYDETSSRGKSEMQVDSPLKRRGNNYSGVETVPPKKLKTETSDRKLRSCEKQFLKLWQAHDLEKIQPNRTRNSLKNFTTENKPNGCLSGNDISNKRPTSPRETNHKRKSSIKHSYDITSYLSKSKKTCVEECKKVTSSNESEVEAESTKTSDRVLRSSRSRSNNSFESPTKNALLRRPRRNSRLKNDDYFNSSSVNVVFTGFDSDSLEKVISDLGGKKTNDLSLGDVVVTEKVRRTVKFLCAIGLSLPITSPKWLVSCKAEQKFLNPWKFLLKDEESEKKWDFDLKASLEKSTKAKLLQGLNVFATENAKPPVKDLLAIVECCGGTPLFDSPDIWPKKTVIVSCKEDSRLWPSAKLRHVKIVHYEFILSGILRQKLDYNKYKLR